MGSFDDLKKENINQEIIANNAINVDLDKIAKEYAEKIRGIVAKEKENQENVHLQDIKPKDLTYDDLIIFDKLLKGNLINEDDKEYKKYRDDISRYFDFQQKSKGDSFDIRRDSRANFAAMIRNKIIEIETKARIEEIRKRKTEGKGKELSL